MAQYTSGNVTSGRYARQVSVSASGPQGAQGTVGASGPKGDNGAVGGLSASYKFLNSYAAQSPGSGYLSFNNPIFMSSTEMYVSHVDSAIDSQQGLLGVMVNSTNGYKSVLTIQDSVNLRKFSRFYVTGSVIASDWRTVFIQYIEGTALSWTYNDLLNLLVSPIGDVGAQGPTGPQGEIGPGVPAGGLAGQVLKKSSGIDYQTEWVDASIDESAVSNLVDVQLSPLYEGQVLVWDASIARWVNQEPEISAENISGIIVGGSATTSF
jgi:hypothetical protein